MSIIELKTFVIECDNCHHKLIVQAENMHTLPTGWDEWHYEVLCPNCIKIK